MRPAFDATCRAVRWNWVDKLNLRLDRSPGKRRPFGFHPIASHRSGKLYWGVRDAWRTDNSASARHPTEIFMQQNIKELIGHRLQALDGSIGQVRDFYFDDKTWAIRYLVADTGSWMTGRLVLLSPHSFGRRDPLDQTLHLKLQKAQIENSPPIEAHKPVSRQYEIDYFKYYGWPAYWTVPAAGGFGGFPMLAAPSAVQVEAQQPHPPREDKHLRSVQAATGYAIHATDGIIGTVSGFLLDDRHWTISHVVVDAGHWYSGKEILIPTGRIGRISYVDSQIFADLTRSDIQQTADHGVLQAGA
jgi:hypothetical protein